MEKNDKKSAPDLGVMVAQSIERAHGAMESYLRFFEKSMSSTPWAGTDLNMKFMKYAEINISNAFNHAQKLVKAKDLQEASQIQTAFFQTQLRLLTEQANDIGEAATRAASDALEGPLKSST